MSYSEKMSESNTRICDMAEEMRPREKAMALGVKSLTDAELMATLFGTGIKGKNVLELCREILREEKDHLSKVAELSVEQLCERFKGIGKVKALNLLAALELGARAASDAVLVDDPQMTSSKLVYEAMRRQLYNIDHEEFWVLLLRTNHRIKRAVRIGQGGINSTSVDVRIILREAIVAGSPAIILVHNHPSGNLNPSQEDIRLTKKVVEAAKVMDIRVLDHVIVVDGAYMSFSDEGLLS